MVNHTPSHLTPRSAEDIRLSILDEARDKDSGLLHPNGVICDHGFAANEGAHHRGEPRNSALSTATEPCITPKPALPEIRREPSNILRSQMSGIGSRRESVEIG